MNPSTIPRPDLMMGTMPMVWVTISVLHLSAKGVLTAL